MITKKLHLHNNEEALSLLGEQDIHLRKLEKDFGVEIFVRQETEGTGVYLSVRGAAPRVEKTLRQLKAMRERLQKGETAMSEDPSKSSHFLEAASIPKEAVYMTAYGKIIKPKGEHQKAYIEAIENYDLVFGIGPAGTGKTFLAVTCALKALKSHQVNRIVLTRPVVETGEKLGFLPGDLYEKVHPYLKPLYDAFYGMLGPDKFRMWRDDEIVEIIPLAYMRGRSLDTAFIILDEAQNTTPEQMKMFLTRMGPGSKMVVTGDITQIDLQNKKQSGLILAKEILKNIPGVPFIQFTEEDVVRHPLVKKILLAYESWERKEE
ncbi:MAG: PhoH family protein [Elusimicrobia bacterium]|nr:PhoH family protein [Elusimicrobiota bacterium]